MNMVYEIDTSQQFKIKWGCKGSERILQNVINLINTFRYEIAYDRTLGIDSDLVDAPAEESSVLWSNDIVRLISEREPRAEIQTVDLTGMDENGTIALKVVVEI